MHEILKKRLELLKDLVSFFDKNKIKYYVSGNILINVYNDIPLKNNVSFEVSVLNKDIKNIHKLNSDLRIIKEFYKDDKKYYRYIDKKSLFINCNDFNDYDEKGIYIKVNLNSTDYKDYKKVSLNKINVMCPKNLDLYLEDNYGLGYKYLKEKVESLSKSIIWSSEIPYNKYYELLKSNNVEIKTELFNELNEKELSDTDYKKITKRYRDIIARTHARYMLLKNYEDKKENILKLHDDKKYNELKNELDEYLSEIKKFYDLNLGLCFDKDIFDVTIDFLKYNGDKKLASWLLKNTPEEHLVNIDFTYKDKIHDTQIKDLQASFEKLLKKFDNFCKENDIVYYLEGGSILGAVRNEGFLP